MDSARATLCNSISRRKKTHGPFAEAIRQR